MSSKSGIYKFFFPEGKKLPFPKLRWTIMIIIQELKMCKYKAVFKYFVNPSYKRDINFLRDILSKGILTSEKTSMRLGDINFSHEINYPEWVQKLVRDLKQSPNNYQRIKVFYTEEKGWIVIDGNHRLKALKTVSNPDKIINVLKLTYK